MIHIFESMCGNIPGESSANNATYPNASTNTLYFHISLDFRAISPRHSENPPVLFRIPRISRVLIKPNFFLFSLRLFLFLLVVAFLQNKTRTIKE